MTDLPLISIVTPCLNAELTIERTITSIETQGYPNVEHIVIDGGSTDGTLDIVRRHPEIRLVSEPDRGLSDALNKGLRMATGELVGWLNADDLYLPGALHSVAEAHATHPAAGWITGHCRIIDGDDQEIRRFVTAYKSALLRRYHLVTLLMQNYVSAPATFLTASGLAEVGEARLDQHYAMDYDLWLRAAHLGKPAVVDRQLAAFRMVPGTLSMSGFERQFEEHAAIAGAHAASRSERAAAAANRALSRLIVLTYRALARRRKG